MVKNQARDVRTPQELEIWIKSYIVARTVEGLSAWTIAFYAEKLKKFTTFCDTAYISDVEEITPNILRRFLLWLQSEGHNPGGIKAHYRTVKTFIRWYIAETETIDYLDPFRKVREMMSTCGDDITGKRDWIVLALLVAAGLRREELVNLRFEDIQEQYTKDGKSRMVLNVTGKGTKDRVIPISDDLARGLLDWQETTGDGLIARSLGRKMELGESISAIGVFNIVRKHGAMIGKPELAPHDLRRTYAQLGYDAGVPITQISKLLGHASVATTQRYLNLDLDLEATASDFIPLK